MNSTWVLPAVNAGGGSLVETREFKDAYALLTFLADQQDDLSRRACIGLGHDRLLPQARQVLGDPVRRRVIGTAMRREPWPRRNMPDWKKPISVNSIKVTRVDIAEISYTLDIALQAYAVQSKDWLQT